MSSTIEISGRRIGAGAPILLTVETGVTCNGDVDTAKRVIDVAAEAGADAVKFMIIGADHFMSDRSVTYDYQWAGGHNSENMYEMFKGLEFSEREWVQIRDHCVESGLIFYTTVDYIAGVDLAEELGVPAYKLSSWDTANLPLIKRMVHTGKPIQIDTGPTTVGEIDKLLRFMRDHGESDALLMHCSHALSDDGINLRSVPYLRDIFQVPVGYSADSRDQTPDLLAVALGACCLEKRVTLDKSFKGHHHIKALEPAEFREWVASIRRAESMLGADAVIPSAEDLRQREMYFVSLVAEGNIPAGTVIREEMIRCKRPGTGIAPEHAPLIIGREARRDIAHNTLISWSDV
ncbi:MAG: N-acetylneuraminate synthase family protein [Phycisphaerales bacterium]|nr:N-acetylneuraminate synthase family protein [Phycisphaerales bacterium]